MNHFEITGWSMQTLREASEKALLLLAELTDGNNRFAVEAHCRDFGALRRLAGVSPTDRCALYCWKSLTEGDELVEARFSALRRAYIRFEGVTVSSDEYTDMLPYDWDGSAPVCAAVSLTTLHPAPLRPEDKEPSAQTIEILSRLVTQTIGMVPEPIKTCTSWRDYGREHSYSMKVPLDKLPRLIATICSAFNLRDGIGSFEFMGTPAQLTAIYENPSFRFDHFPSTCWNLNYPADTVFSYGVRAFHYPVPTVQREQLLLLASAIDELRQRVASHHVITRYLAWNLSRGERSPNTRGNYLLISQQNGGGYALFLGYERYEDKDPPVSRFTSFAVPVLERMGARLKRVSGPR